MTKVEEKIKKIIDSISAYRVLPQGEYQAIGEFLLPLAIDASVEIDRFQEQVKSEWENKYYDSIVALGEKQATMECEIRGKTYILSVFVKR